MVQQNKGSWQKENNPKTTSHGFSGGELFFLPIFPLLGTSKMRFTNNRLTGLQTDKTWLGSSRLSRAQKSAT